jgi:hypothetical protein
MSDVQNTINPATPVQAYALLGGDHALRGRRLFQTGLGLLAAALVYLTFTAKVADTFHLYQGLTIFTLSFVPGLLWARSGGSRFPVFEPIMLLCANSYAIPLLSGHEQLVLYPPDVINKAAWAVIFYQVSAIAAYSLTRGQPCRSGFWTEEILGRQVEKLLVYGLVLSTAYIAVSTLTLWVPADLESILRAVFFGIGILCTFISAQRWGRGELTQSDKAVVVGTLVPQLILQTTGLLLIGSVSLVGIALLGYLSGGKRIPWVPMFCAFVILAVLHNGKSQMRTKYWEQSYPAPTVAQLPAFYAEWFAYGLQPPVENSSGERNLSTGRKLLERTSLMHILCLIVNYSPERQPFLNGETYGYVLPQLIPHLFWPDKPRAHQGTYRLAIYYGLQDEDATNSTTIAFGMLAEAYANFGVIGGILLGIFWGVGLKKLQVLSQQSPMFSLAGLLMILLTAWSFNSEHTMAVWISSLYQAIIVVLGVPFALRSLFGT